MTIGGRIQELRKEMQMSQTDLAKKAGVQSGTLSRYENDLITSPNIPILMRIAAALGANPQYIIDGSLPKSLNGLTGTVNDTIGMLQQLPPEKLAMIQAAIKAIL